MCFVVYLRFPAVSRLVFDMFRCRPVGDGVRLLEANYQQECFEPEHWIFFCVGVFFLCAYTLGIPCFILYQLTSYKTTILGRPASEEFQKALDVIRAQFRLLCAQAKMSDVHMWQNGGKRKEEMSF